MENRTLIIRNQIEELEKLSKFTEALGTEWSQKAELVFELNLILEEYITNLVSYGYHDKENHEIIIEINKEKNQLKIIVTDDAGPFNIIETSDNEDIDKPVDERKIGGLGIHFIKKLTDGLNYTSEGGRNQLIIIKKIN